MRLQQYLARSGITSRRKAEDLIRAGRVSINDHVAEIGATVGENDVVRLDGERVRLPQKTVVIALNKPRGYTTTHEDSHAEKLVYELVPEHPGLHSVGRLDKDTEGLLLLTNDGELTAFLSHPRNQVPKLYRAWSKRGRLSEEDCKQLEAGVMLGDGLAKAVEAQPVKEGVKLVLTEGHKREVRRMLGRVGHPVERLVRLAVGPMELGELGGGEWRYLSPEEVRLLRSNPAMPSLKKGARGREPGVGEKQRAGGRGQRADRSGRHRSDRQKTASGRDFAGSPREENRSPAVNEGGEPAPNSPPAGENPTPQKARLEGVILRVRLEPPADLGIRLRRTSVLQAPVSPEKTLEAPSPRLGRGKLEAKNPRSERSLLEMSVVRSGNRARVLVQPAKRAARCRQSNPVP